MDHPKDIATRTEEVERAILSLNPMEQQALRLAANNGEEGGGELPAPLRQKATKLGLAYEGSGRLRTDVYKKLRTSAPTAKTASCY